MASRTMGRSGWSPELRSALAQTTAWRLSAQYLRIARTVCDLLAELARATQNAAGTDRRDLAMLLVAA